MSRFKDLIFRTSKFDLNTEMVSKAFITKVFHLYQKRNERVNWQGYTSAVTRSWLLFDLNLQESMDSAEDQRTQGTRFLIDEIPAICVVGMRYALILTELFTEKPLNYYEMPACDKAITLRKVESILNSGQWFVSAVYTGEPGRLPQVTEKENVFLTNILFYWRKKPSCLDIKT